MLERLLAVGAGGAAGLEHSPAMLAFSESRNTVAVEGDVWEPKPGEAARIPWPGESFGVLVCANMFFFLARAQRPLAELRRVLRPGGRVVIATQPGPLPRASRRSWWVAVWGSTMHVYSDAQMGELLGSAGFTDLTVRTEGGHQLARAISPESASNLP